jgi:serine/threonine protein kinase
MPIDIANWLGRSLANGRYDVTAKLGEGGMALIYRARDLREDRDVVVKVPQFTEPQKAEFTARFLREIRSLVHLTHPHIVQILDVDEQEGVPFAVLPFLAGGSLRDRLERGPQGEIVPFRPEELKVWLDDVADALDYIHGQGYIHRDVKPDNILFDAEGKVYLGDFGIAKVVAAESPARKPGALTETGMVMGTVEYMPPELIMGESCDGRVDQYALGIVVYELLAGRRPFDGPNPAAILVKQTAQKLRPLEKVMPGTPQKVSNAVQRALAKKPSERFLNCSAFAHAVSSAVEEEQRGGVESIRVVSCPTCAQLLRIPSRGDVMWFRCPACKTVFDPASILVHPQMENPESASDGGRIGILRSQTKPSKEKRFSTGILAPQSRRIFAMEREIREVIVADPRDQQCARTRMRSRFAAVAILGGLSLIILTLIGSQLLQRPHELEPEQLAPRTVTSPKNKLTDTIIEPQRPHELESEQLAPRTVTSPKNKLTDTIVEPQRPHELESEQLAPRIVTSPKNKLTDTIVEPFGEVHRFDGHTVFVRSLAFSPNGRRIVSAPYLGGSIGGIHGDIIRVWDVETGNAISSFARHTDNINRVVVSSNGRYVLSASNESLWLWDLETGQPYRSLQGHTDWVMDATFSPNGTTAVSCGRYDRTIRLWDVKTAREIRRFSNHTDAVWSVAFSPNGRNIISGSSDKTVRLWDANTGKELHRFLDHRDMVWTVAISPDGKYALSGGGDPSSKQGGDFSIRIWDFEKRNLVARLHGHKHCVSELCFSPNGKRALSASELDGIILWNLDTHEEITRLPGNFAIAFSPDGRTVAFRVKKENSFVLWRLSEIEAGVAR